MRVESLWRTIKLPMRAASCHSSWMTPFGTSAAAMVFTSTSAHQSSISSSRKDVVSASGRFADALTTFQVSPYSRPWK